MLNVIRYRFLLFAGIFPYVLGAVVCFHYNRIFDWFYFTVGFLALLLILVGVEVFNEYFDYKIGGDRAFLTDKRIIPQHYFKIGIFTFILAFFIAVYLTFYRGLAIIIFAFIGAISAFFYVSPPIQWSYRGLGETIIFLNYGPFITLGSYFLQAQKIDLGAFFSSLVPGFLIFSLSLINEIPDYYGDRLVGKKNIVVRLGKKRTVILYGITIFLSFFVLTIFILNRFSIFILLTFLTLPLAYKNFLVAIKNNEIPKKFVSAIKGTIFLYTIIMVLFIVNYII